MVAPSLRGHRDAVIDLTLRGPAHGVWARVPRPERTDAKLLLERPTAWAGAKLLVDREEAEKAAVEFCMAARISRQIRPREANKT